MRRLLPKPLAGTDTTTLVLLALLLIAASARLVIITSLPLWLDLTATHDDALYLRLAMSLAAGNWLGPYDQLTLLQGPGYPLFLAAASLSWLPVSLAHALMQTVAIAVAAWAVYRLASSRVLAAIAFLTLAFDPAGFVPDMQRVIPAQIGWAQALLVFSLIALALYAPPAKRSHRMGLSALAGLLLGWAWITRSDSAWLLPGLIVLAAGALLVHRKGGEMLSALLGSIGLTAAAALAVIAGVMGINLAAYGTFAVSDLDGPGFKAALQALQSVEDDDDNPFLPVPAAVRAKVAKVSPSFAPIKRALDTGDIRQRWHRIVCGVEQRACGDYAGRWFASALRDAAAKTGAYASPEHAEQTFAAIADEIAAACAKGKLKCSRPPAVFPQPPAKPTSPTYLPPTIETIGTKVAFIVPPGAGGLNLTRADVMADKFERSWSFLNRPFVSTPGKAGVKTTASGWYRDSRSTRWPGFAVYASDGTSIPYVIERRTSSDLQRHFADERLAFNRFTISYVCPDTCTIAALRFGQDDVRAPTDRTGAYGTTSGSATVYIDRITYDWAATADRYWLRSLAERLLDMLLPGYAYLAPLALFAGLVVLLAACDGAIATRWLNPLLLISAAAWTMAAARILSLVPANAVSLVTVELRDYLPAIYMALLASFLSFGAAVVQARRL